MNPMALFMPAFSRTLFGVMLASLAGMLLPGSGRTPYFLSAGTFFVAAIALSMAALALYRPREPLPNAESRGGIPEALAHAAGTQEKPGPATATAPFHADAGYACGLIAFAMFGYALMELFYGFINLRLGLASYDSAWTPFFGELDTYVLDRSYQYLALGVFFLLVRSALGGTFGTFVALGDGTRETTVLGEEQPMPWRRACLRLVVMLVGLAALGFLARPQSSFAPARWPLYFGRLLGGTNNSFIEELLFRGLLLPALLVRLAAGPANWLQAVLFALIHWGYVADDTWQPVQQELVKLGLYTGIGLLLGRAAVETRGIGISTLLHALITAAIWSHLTFGGG